MWGKKKTQTKQHRVHTLVRHTNSLTGISLTTVDPNMRGIILLQQFNNDNQECIPKGQVTPTLVTTDMSLLVGLQLVRICVRGTSTFRNQKDTVIKWHVWGYISFCANYRCFQQLKTGEPAGVYKINVLRTKNVDQSIQCDHNRVFGTAWHVLVELPGVGVGVVALHKTLTAFLSTHCPQVAIQHHHTYGP